MSDNPAAFPAAPPTNGHAAIQSEPIHDSIEVGGIEFSEPCPAQLFTALAAFQGATTNPPKDKKVTIQPNQGRAYSYFYADLATIIDHIRPSLSLNGLAIMQATSTGTGKLTITTILTHASGQWARQSVDWPTDTRDIKGLGASITYLRRYSIQSILGIAADEDNDTQTENATHEARAVAKPVAAPQPVHAPAAVVTMPTPPPPAAAERPQPDVKTTEPAAAQPKIEDKRKAMSVEIREALGLSPTADTNVATAVAKVYRGYIGAPKSGKLPDAQANDLNRWHECLIGLRDGIKGQLITKDDLQKDAYSVGVQLRQVVDAAPEEEPDAAEPQQSAAAPVDVTDEMLQQRWGTPTLKGANWLANLLGKANLPARDDAELAAFRRLAYHTKMVGLAVSPKFTLAQVVKGVEATIGKTLTADPALTADMEVALTQVVNGLNGVVTQ